ncbi:hypothetical protein NQZ68_031718 [Dissostichus eleginoides]|nr:hypothetical protein NQZ68_031718 [Dissostichus eleginoides]
MGGIAALVSSACSIADYMEHAASQQLFLCYGDGALGKLFSKQTRWLYEGISHAWELADSDPRSHWRALHPSLSVISPLHLPSHLCPPSHTPFTSQLLPFSYHLPFPPTLPSPTSISPSFSLPSPPLTCA